MFEQGSLTVSASICNLGDYSEKSLVSDKGTELLPDCGRNQDKIACVSLLYLSLLISVAK